MADTPASSDAKSWRQRVVERLTPFESVDFDKIERAAGVTFNHKQRRNIYFELTEYVGRRLTEEEMPKGRKAIADLDNMIQRVDDLLAAIESSVWTEHLGWLASRSRAFDLRKFRHDLKFWRGVYVAERSGFQGRGRPLDVTRLYLLNNLHKVFSEAGGDTTNNNRADDGRQSRFIDFVVQAMAVVSDEIRVVSHSELITFWEKYRRPRRRGLKE